MIDRMIICLFCTTMRKDDILYSLRALIKQVMPAGTKVFLFGSQARGDVHDESDWDILILLDKEKITSADFDTYAYPLIDLGWQFGEYFSTKLYTFIEWMKRKVLPFQECGGTRWYRTMNLTDEEQEASLFIARKDANEILPLMDSVDNYLNTLLSLIEGKA